MTDPTAPPEGAPSWAPARPEPVLGAAKVAGLVGALVVAVLGLAAIVVNGQAGDLTAVGYAVSGVLTAAAAAAAGLAPYWQALKARAQVTPLVDPRDDRGTPLVVDTGGGVTAAPHVAAPQTPGVADHAAPGDAG